MPLVAGARSEHDVSAPGAVSYSGGVSVNAIDDETGNGHVIDAASGPDEPDHNGATLNGVTGIAFDGAAWMIDWGDSDFSQPATVHIVCSLTQAQTDGFGAALGHSCRLMRWPTDATKMYMDAGSALVDVGTVDNNPHVFTAIFDGASSEFYVDGVGGTIGTNPGTNVFRLALGDSSYKPDMVFWHVVVYASHLGSSDLATNHAFLNTKWFGGGGTDVNPTATTSSPRSAVATVTATAQVNPTATAAIAVSAVATVTATAQVDPTATTSSPRSAVADVGGATAVNPAATVVVTVSAVAAVTATTQVNPVGSVSSPRSAVASVSTTATTDVDPAPTIAVAVSAIAVVTATTQVNPSASTSSPRSAVAIITATTEVNPVGAVSSPRSAVTDVIGGEALLPVTAIAVVVSATAVVTATSTVDPVGAVSSPRSAVGQLAAAAAINPAPTYAAAVSATASIFLVTMAVTGPFTLTRADERRTLERGDDPRTLEAL